MKISLNGGIIIIGSLYWDNDVQRINWRKKSLNLENQISVKAPIRYGRISSERNYTFSMVLSSECKNPELNGNAIFVPFKKNPIDYENLEIEMGEIIKAEQKRENLKNSNNNWGWGTLGILINPKALDQNSEKFNEVNFLLSKWKDKYSSGFKYDEYKVGEESAIINKSGVFQFYWPENLKDFDFIIATATKPEVDNYPESQNIIDRIIQNKYAEYYLKNIQHGITTFQDNQISQKIK